MVSSVASHLAFPGVSLKLWLLGNLIAAVAYGLALSLSITCLNYFLPGIRTPTISRTTPSISFPSAGNNNSVIAGRVRLSMVLYIMFMLLLSTMCLIAGTWSTFELLFPDESTFNHRLFHFIRYADACTLVFANWGADGLMVSVLIDSVSKWTI